MDAKLWERIKEVFSFVIAQGPDDVFDVLIQACNGDNDLASHVRPLVEEHFRILNSVAVPASQVELYAEGPSLLAGRYRVLSRLGGGSFGDVYRVSDDAAGGAELALKVLRSSDPTALRYFKREFRSLTGIHHRNI